MSDAEEPLLEVDGLRTLIHADRGTIPAVDGVSFHIDRGETVCLVGESGSGKSVTCESVTGIVPRPPAEIVDGSIRFDGLELRGASTSQLRRIRGNRIAHVFQNPQQALDPVYTVGEQLTEAMAIHDEDATDADLRRRGIDLLRRVGIPDAATRFDDYPHEFSGGMRQRVAIAIAMSAQPELIIADEPTTSVDVTVQARIIELFRQLTGEGLSVLWVTHDLRVVATIADRVIVMYGGTLVEEGTVEDIFNRPAHPYTQALLASHAGEWTRSDARPRHELPRDGCRYRQDCPHAIESCAGPEQPPYHDVPGTLGHQVSCVHYAPGADPSAILEDARRASPIEEVTADD